MGFVDLSKVVGTGVTAECRHITPIWTAAVISPRAERPNVRRWVLVS